jgi:hypothetical protein
MPKRRVLTEWTCGCPNDAFFLAGLHVYAMTGVEVPQSHSMYQYLKEKRFEEVCRDQDPHVITHHPPPTLVFRHAPSAIFNFQFSIFRFAFAFRHSVFTTHPCHACVSPQRSCGPRCTYSLVE